MICSLCRSPKAVFFHKIDKYQYYLCSHCQTLFLKPQLRPEKLNNFYKNEFQYREGLNKENYLRNRSQKILNYLLNLNPEGKTLLDIGSGYGFLMDEAKNRGLTVEGLEPSYELYRYSQRHLYLNITNKNLSDFQFRKKYDFITLIHVIEHLNNPKAVLIKVLSGLNKNGILYIETPNLDSYLFQAELKGYTFLTPPEHLWLFSSYSIKRLLKNISKLDIKYHTYSEPEHFMGILKKLIRKTSDNKNNKEITTFITFRNSKNLIKKIKIILFDKLLAKLFTPFLNIFNKGTILEIYIHKR